MRVWTPTSAAPWVPAPSFHPFSRGSAKPVIVSTFFYVVLPAEKLYLRDSEERGASICRRGHLLPEISGLEVLTVPIIDMSAKLCRKSLAIFGLPRSRGSTYGATSTAIMHYGV